MQNRLATPAFAERGDVDSSCRRRQYRPRQLANLTGYKAERANRWPSAPRTAAHPGELTCSPSRSGVDQGRRTRILLLELHQGRSAGAGPGGHRHVGGHCCSLGVERAWLLVRDLSAIPCRSSRRSPRYRCSGLVPYGCWSRRCHYGRPVQRPVRPTSRREGVFDASCDHTAGAANVIAGVFQNAGRRSMSASSLNKSAGARDASSHDRQRGNGCGDQSLFAVRSWLCSIAMFAWASTVVLVGYRTIKPGDLQSVWDDLASVQKVVLLTTFALTGDHPIAVRGAVESGPYR